MVIGVFRESLILKITTLVVSVWNYEFHDFEYQYGKNI